MRAHPFRVGDKVVPAYDLSSLSTVPRPVQGRVYCVAAVVAASSEKGDFERVVLVGIRTDRRCKGGDDSIPAHYFRRVSDPPLTHQQETGGQTDGQ